MLGANLDLEADLSIDSIKRTEIIMELADRMGLARAGGPVAEGITEQLAALKTIGAIVAWIMERAEAQPRPGSPTFGVLSSPGERNPPNLANLAPEGRPDPDPPGPPAPVPARPQRYVVEITSSASKPPETPSADLRGLRFVVVDDGAGVGAATAAALRRRGAGALLLDVHHDLESSCASVDGVIHLGALRPGKPPVLPAAFAPLRAAILGGARMLLVATGSGGTF